MKSSFYSRGSYRRGKNELITKVKWNNKRGVGPRTKICSARVNTAARHRSFRETKIFFSTVRNGFFLGGGKVVFLFHFFASSGCNRNVSAGFELLMKCIKMFYSNYIKMYGNEKT